MTPVDEDCLPILEKARALNAETDVVLADLRRRIFGEEVTA